MKTLRVLNLVLIGLLMVAACTPAQASMASVKLAKVRFIRSLASFPL